jgi:hypothetical protein
MALTTGTPLGNIDTMEDLFLEGAPSIYFQDYNATPAYNPDAQGFYWGLSGTSTYPAYEVGCPFDLSLSENLTVNDVLCDTVGTKDTIQQRNYIEFTFSLRSFFPFQIMRHILGFGPVTETSGPPDTQKMGIGSLNNTQFWTVYAPKVYDEDNADYIWIHLHKAKFVDPWTINMTFGNPWTATGLKLRAFVDGTKPAAQKFGMWGRSDASAVPFV